MIKRVLRKCLEGNRLEFSNISELYNDEIKKLYRNRALLNMLAKKATLDYMDTVNTLLLNPSQDIDNRQLRNFISMHLNNFQDYLRNKLMKDGTVDRNMLQAYNTALFGNNSDLYLTVNPDGSLHIDNDFHQLTPAIDAYIRSETGLSNPNNIDALRTLLTSASQAHLRGSAKGLGEYPYSIGPRFLAGHTVPAVVWALKIDNDKFLGGSSHLISPVSPGSIALYKLVMDAGKGEEPYDSKRVPDSTKGLANHLIIGQAHVNGPFYKKGEDQGLNNFYMQSIQPASKIPLSLAQHLFGKSRGVDDLVFDSDKKTWNGADVWTGPLESILETNNGLQVKRAGKPEIFIPFTPQFKFGGRLMPIKIKF